MLRTLALALCALSLGPDAFAQDAKALLASAQKALGDVRSITYSGSASDVAFRAWAFGGSHNGPSVDLQQAFIPSYRPL